MIVLKEEGLDAEKAGNLYQLLEAVRKYYSQAEEQLKRLRLKTNN